MSKIEIPPAILEAARRAAASAEHDVWSQHQTRHGAESAPSTATCEAAKVEAAVRAAFLAAVQHFPAPAPPPVDPERVPGVAARFMRVVYELAGERPVGLHAEEEMWPVDLFEVERRVAHQDQAAGAAQLIQPAE